MDIRQLRYFVAVVESRSFSRAAEIVHVAQSALSQQVRKLEEALGVRLLVRSARGVHPTAAGEKMLAHARAVLNQISDAERDVRDAADAPAGSVSIGIPSGVGRLLNAVLLRACAHELPQVSLRIVEVLPSHVLEWLDKGLIQLGVHYVLGAPSGGALLAEENLHLVSGAPEPGLEANVNLTDLSRYPLILPTCTFNPRQCVAAQAESMGIHLSIETRVDSLATILDLVIASPGRSVLTPAAVRAEWDAGQLYAYEIDPPMTRYVMMDVCPSASADSAVRAVEALVLRTAHKLVSDGVWQTRLPSVRPQPGGDDMSASSHLG